MAHEDYGDETFLYLLREQEEETKQKEAQQEARIENGRVVLGEETWEFARNPIWEDGFSMILPTAFELLSEDLAQIKYPYENRPDFILSSPDTTINLTFSYPMGQMELEEASNIRDSIEGILVQLREELVVQEKDVFYVGEVPIAWLEFTSKAIDSYLYNLMFFFGMEGQALFGSFNCLVGQREEWQPILQQILHSTTFP